MTSCALHESKQICELRCCKPFNERCRRRFSKTTTLERDVSTLTHWSSRYWAWGYWLVTLLSTHSNSQNILNDNHKSLCAAWAEAKQPFLTPSLYWSLEMPNMDYIRKLCMCMCFCLPSNKLARHLANSISFLSVSLAPSEVDCETIRNSANLVVKSTTQL